MLRTAAARMLGGFRSAALSRPANQVRMMSHKVEETDEEFDKRYENYFNRPDIDGWEIRKAFNDLAGMDLIPDPKIIAASLKACRRVNDYALAVRWIETLRVKANFADKAIYPYLLQELKPTLDELGINTPEELGYDKPELYLRSVYHPDN